MKGGEQYLVFEMITSYYAQNMDTFHILSKIPLSNVINDFIVHFLLYYGTVQNFIKLSEYFYYFRDNVKNSINMFVWLSFTDQ